MHLLEIRNLKARIEEKPILKGLSLSIPKGEVHAVMGPNGAGKSTLARVLAGHPAYEVTEGEVWFQGQNLLEQEPEDRARAGLFMGFQYPVEIAGVSNAEFLRMALQERDKVRGKEPLTQEAFDSLLQEKARLLGIPLEFLQRGINEGFSGGEKKRNEILQMALLEPSLAVLDETDSGLDIDAMRRIAEGINQMRSPQRSFLIITHYERLLQSIRPDVVHVFQEGVITQSGDARLAAHLEEQGYAQ